MQPSKDIEVRRYFPADRYRWNAFIQASKNGVFLFLREYMDYHSDRYLDHSLLFFDDEGTLIGVMPANSDGKTLYSHGGLTFGGIVTNYHITTVSMLSIVSSLKEYMRSQGIERLIYKAIPYIYHRIPSDEDLYALTVNGAKLIRRDVSSTIPLSYLHMLPFWRMRKRTIKRGLEAKLRVESSTDFDSFMKLQASVLQARHNVLPVHTVEEIKYLASLFPDRIKLYTASKDEAILASVLMFEHDLVAHAQYSANSDEGRLIGASDVIYNYLINTVYRDKRFFDFGISTEEDGMYLNTGLIRYKESFGGRAVAYDFYELASGGNKH